MPPRDLRQPFPVRVLGIREENLGRRPQSIEVEPRQCAPRLDVIAQREPQHDFPLEREPVTQQSVQRPGCGRDPRLVQGYPEITVRGVRQIDRRAKIGNCALCDPQRRPLLPPELVLLQLRGPAAGLQIHHPFHEIA